MTQVDASTIGYYAFYVMGPALAVGAWLIGLVLHGLGRSTRLALTAAIFGVGLLMGTALTASLGFVERQASLGWIVSAMWLLAVPLVSVIVLAMAGRRRSAGLILIGAAAPWTAIYGWFGVEVLLGRNGAALLIVALFLAGLGPLLIGVALLVSGDVVHEPDPNSPMGRPGSRRPGSMGTRLIGEATYGAVGPAVVVAFIAALSVGFIVPGQLILQLVVAVTAAVVGTEIELRWIPPRVRPAVESFHWVGLGELARFRAATGEASPASVKGFQTWLARHPESDVTRPWRIEMLTYLGEYGQARAELEHWTPSRPFDRLHHASMAAEIGWEQGAPADVAALASQAIEIVPDGSPERLAADGLIAWWSSRTALAAMDPDWQRPLATFRARLGAAADGLHARALRRRTLVPPVIVAVGFVLLGQVNGVLLG